MIVPSMTAPQAAEDARKDWISLWNKIKPICKAQEHKHRTDRQRLDRIESLKAWRSPRGNNWLIVLSTSKKGTDYAAFVWYRGEDDRLRTIRVDLLRTAADVYYTAHLLERYNERFDPSRDPIQRLSEFIFANHHIAVSGTKDLGDGRMEVLCGMLHGNATGVYEPAAKMYHLTTFLDHGLLDHQQQTFTEALDLQRYFRFMTPGQRAHIIRGVEKEIGKQEAKGPVKDKVQVMALMKQLAGLDVGTRAA